MLIIWAGGSPGRRAPWHAQRMDSLERGALEVEESLGATTETVQKSMKHAITAATLLLAITFVEDSIRICKLFEFQYHFIMSNNGAPESLAKLFLLASFVTQVSACTLVLPASPALKKNVCWALLCCVSVQPPMYGQLGNIIFVSMSIAQIGALLLLAASCHDELRSKEGSKEVPGDCTLRATPLEPPADRGLRLAVELTEWAVPRSHSFGAAGALTKLFARLLLTGSARPPRS